MKRLLYVSFDQLHRDYGVLKNADPATDHVVMVESQRMLNDRAWHKQRLFFLVSSARHFADALRADGFRVDYVQAPTTVAGIQTVWNPATQQLVACQPHSFILSANLEELGATLIPNDFFLTSREDFDHWAQKQKSHIMESFYRVQRKRLDILMDGDQPRGGQWNFDQDNRLPPPKNYAWPAALHFEPDAIDKQVINELPNSAWGDLPGGYWATTREGALKQLQFFLEVHFEYFGPYEDAMPSESWNAHHSLVSPYINNGLLHPAEVIEAALQHADEHKTPLSSVEGFVRQIIGWREYINGMYWFLGPDYRNRNGLQANRDLLPLFHNPQATEMNCVRSIVSDVQHRGWVHHIPRLMVLSNLALLVGISPQQYLDWMREVFIDAADWVMVPNVIGMATHADGGQLMTKPYAAGGAYISKMSNYCKPCRFNPKNRTGDDACPFTTLYWNFLDRHEDNFKSNHRMRQQYFGLERLSDRFELRERAKEVIHGLERGEL